MNDKYKHVPHGWVYVIYNLVNGFMYVGKTTKTAEDRFEEHKKEARNGKASTLCKAIRKYGEENFIVRSVDVAFGNSQLNLREIYWIQQLNTCVWDEGHNGYNMTRGGDGFSKLSREQELWVVERYELGFPIMDIAYEFGVSSDPIRNALQKFNVKIRTNEKPVVAYSIAGLEKGNFELPEPRYFPSVTDAAKTLVGEGSPSSVRSVISNLCEWLSGRALSVNHVFGYRWYWPEDQQLFQEWFDDRVTYHKRVRRKVLVTDKIGTKWLFASSDEAVQFIATQYYGRKANFERVMP